VPLDRVRLIAAKSGLGRHRKLHLARPQGSAPVSASSAIGSSASPDPRARPPSRPRTTDFVSPDPRARTQPWPRKTMDSVSPDPRARTQPWLRKTTNSTSPDPRARTQPWFRKTTNSASPSPGLELSLVLGRRSPPRPTRGSDSTSTSEDRLDLDLGGASASPDPGLEPTTSHGGASLPYP
jgi:hypothetical protein